MKTKLYRKVLKMSRRELLLDPRPSTHSIPDQIHSGAQKRLEREYKHYVTVHNIGFWTLRQAEIAKDKWVDAYYDKYLQVLMTLVVWTFPLYHNKLNLDGTKRLRYQLHDKIYKKYSRYRRRYWSDEEVLLRAIAGKKDYNSLWQKSKNFVVQLISKVSSI